MMIREIIMPETFRFKNGASITFSGNEEQYMSWLTDLRGCGKCKSCGMDMDLEPYCAHSEVKRFHKHPHGININVARRDGSPCGPDGALFEQRKGTS